MLFSPFLELTVKIFGWHQVQIPNQWQRGRSRGETLGSSTNIAKAVGEEREERDDVEGIWHLSLLLELFTGD